MADVSGAVPGLWEGSPLTRWSHSPGSDLVCVGVPPSSFLCVFPRGNHILVRQTCTKPQALGPRPLGPGSRFLVLRFHDSWLWTPGCRCLVRYSCFCIWNFGSQGSILLPCSGFGFLVLGCWIWLPGLRRLPWNPGLGLLCLDSWLGTPDLNSRLCQKLIPA